MAKFLLSAFADEYADSFIEQLEGLQRFDIKYSELRFIDKKNIAELNVAEVNDVKSKLDFYGITEVVQAVVSDMSHASEKHSLEEILLCDREARALTQKYIAKH